MLRKDYVHTIKKLIEKIQDQDREGWEEWQQTLPDTSIEYGTFYKYWTPEAILTECGIKPDIARVLLKELK